MKTIVIRTLPALALATVILASASKPVKADEWCPYALGGGCRYIAEKVTPPPPTTNQSIWGDVLKFFGITL